MAITLFWWIESTKSSFVIGETQTDVISTYMESNNIKYSIHSDLRDSVKISINSILDNGGLVDPVLKSNYVLWKKGDKECFPDDWEIIKRNLAIELGKNFVEDITFGIIRKDDNLSILLNIPIIIHSEGQRHKLDYSENYEENYIVEGFNFDDFVDKSSKIKDIVNSCKDKKSCWEEEISKLNEFELIESKDKLFKFEFTTQGLIQEKKVKVAIDFEEELNLGEEELKC